MRRLACVWIFCLYCSLDASERFPVPSPESVKETEAVIRELGKAEVFDLSYADFLDFIWDRYILGSGDDFTYGGCNPASLTEERAKLPATILLHGAGANQGHWAPFIAYMNKAKWNGPVFAYNDSEGRGFDALIDKILEVRDLYLKAGEHEVEIYLVGHSLGAICAAEYAYQPDLWIEGTRVAKVVAMGGRLRNMEPPVETPYYPYCFDVLERIDHIWGVMVKNWGRVKLCTIAGAEDWLVPLESMLVGDQQVVIENQGHALINRFPGACRAAVEFLYLGAFCKTPADRFLALSPIFAI